MVIDVARCGDIWPLERPDGMPSILSLEVMCGKDHMDVHLSFSHPFEGIVSSKGQHGDPRCVYVPPSTGQTFFSFRIAYARCGTKPDLHGQFYENTVVVQYDKDLLEVWDEAKRLRCEWFNDYEKTASKPPMVIADLDVIQLDFRGDNVDCWMEIQHGKGPWAPPVSGIVPLGSTLTLVVAINDYRGEFDMRVKSCIASDGGGHVIRLSDEYGCVLRPKMISRFLKARGADDRASVITYAFFHAFKFPDALSVHIKCKVEICRHGCLDHCQLQPGNTPDVGGSDLAHYINPLERKDVDQKSAVKPGHPEVHELDYEDIIQEGEGGTDIKSNFPPVSVSSQIQDVKLNDGIEEDPDITVVPHKEKFPHGPRRFEEDILSIGAPRSMPDNAVPNDSPPDSKEQQSNHPKTKRKRRSVSILDRQARSADVGVSGLYEVISEADLAFSPDNRIEAVTVFQGKIREEVVYGICMPVPGFSVLFVMVAVSAVVSALVAGSLLYRYQLQREHMVEQAQQNGAIQMSSFVNWMRLLKYRHNTATTMTESNGSVDGVVLRGNAAPSSSANEEIVQQNRD
ncbi:putative zona pellucida (ZP) domain protein [Trypoxylus dichotomus]